MFKKIVKLLKKRAKMLCAPNKTAQNESKTTKQEN